MLWSEGGVGGQNRIDLSFCIFPCFKAFGGPVSTKSAIVTPLLCASVLVETQS